MKTLIIFGNAVGGVGTTTTAAHIAEALRLLGYSIHLLDGDSANRTVSGMCPSATPLDVTNTQELVQLFGGGSFLNIDTIVVDAPANSWSAFKRFFASQHSDQPQKLGIRVVVGTVIDQSEYSVVGGAEWIQSFPTEVDHLLVVNSIGPLAKDDTLRHLFHRSLKSRMVRIPQLGSPNFPKLDPHKALSFVTPLAEWITGLDVRAKNQDRGKTS